MRYLKIMVFLMICIFFILESDTVYAHGSYFSEFFGIGLSSDFTYSQHNYCDGGVSLGGKLGWVGIIGGLLTTEIGYHFYKREIRGKIGIEGYLFILGLKLDFSFIGDPFDHKFYPGIDYYVIVFFPFENFFPFLFIGGQSFLEYGTELNIGISLYYALNELEW